MSTVIIDPDYASGRRGAGRDERGVVGRDSRGRRGCGGAVVGAVDTRHGSRPRGRLAVGLRGHRRATTFGVTTIIWITLTQLLASGLGGYLAGRLRTKWADALGDEVYFRDTAHGFLAWCVASIATAAVLTSVVGSIASGGLQAGAAVAGQAVDGRDGGRGASAAARKVRRRRPDGEPMGYFVDSLFRPERAERGAGRRRAAASAAEVTRIFANAIRTGTLPEDDVSLCRRS